MRGERSSVGCPRQATWLAIHFVNSRAPAPLPRAGGYVRGPQRRPGARGHGPQHRGRLAAGRQHRQVGRRARAGSAAVPRHQGWCVSHSLIWQRASERASELGAIVAAANAVFIHPSTHNHPSISRKLTPLSPLTFHRLGLAPGAPAPPHSPQTARNQCPSPKSVISAHFLSS